MPSSSVNLSICMRMCSSCFGWNAGSLYPNPQSQYFLFRLSHQGSPRRTALQTPCIPTAVLMLTLFCAISSPTLVLLNAMFIGLRKSSRILCSLCLPCMSESGRWRPLMYNFLALLSGCILHQFLPSSSLLSSLLMKFSQLTSGSDPLLPYNVF